MERPVAVSTAPCHSHTAFLTLPSLAPHHPFPVRGKVRARPGLDQGMGVNSPPRDINPLTNPTHPFYSHPRVRWGLTPIRSPSFFCLL